MVYVFWEIPNVKRGYAVNGRVEEDGVLLVITGGRRYVYDILVGFHARASYSSFTWRIHGGVLVHFRRYTSRGVQDILQGEGPL